MSRKKYQEKNLFKIIINTILTKVYSNKFKDPSCMLKLLAMRYEFIPYPFNFHDLVDINEFLSWLKLNIFIPCLFNFKGFKWFFAHENDNLDWKERHFVSVLRNLIRWFMEEEVYHCFIFEKNFSSVDPKIYLQKIPRILAGIDHPKNFFSLNS